MPHRHITKENRIETRAILNILLFTLATLILQGVVLGDGMLGYRYKG